MQGSRSLPSSRFFSVEAVNRTTGQPNTGVRGPDRTSRGGSECHTSRLSLPPSGEGWGDAFAGRCRPAVQKGRAGPREGFGESETRLFRIFTLKMPTGWVRQRRAGGHSGGLGTERLQATETDCPPGLEAGSPKSRCRQSWFRPEPPRVGPSHLSLGSRGAGGPGHCQLATHGLLPCTCLCVLPSSSKAPSRWNRPTLI